VAHPTDSHLLLRGIEWLNRLAKKHRGLNGGAILKAVGFIIPLSIRRGRSPPKHVTVPWISRVVPARTSLCARELSSTFGGSDVQRIATSATPQDARRIAAMVVMSGRFSILRTYTERNIEMKMSTEVIIATRETSIYLMAANPAS
jgi:hypothetical protein